MKLEIHIQWSCINIIADKATTIMINREQETRLSNYHQERKKK